MRMEFYVACGCVLLNLPKQIMRTKFFEWLKIKIYSNLVHSVLLEMAEDLFNATELHVTTVFLILFTAHNKR